MIVRENGTYNERYKSWEQLAHQPYDYKNEGLVKKILSHKITESDSPIIQYILQIYEESLVFCMKYIDILQNYFNYNWKNR